MHEHREVRVTARQSVRTPFVAPVQAPVPALQRELEKGTKGWTDFDVKVPDLTGSHLPTGLAERLIEEMKAGGAVRKAPSNAVRIRSRYLNTGPTAAQRAARQKASIK